jgi:recombination endonuclease VII
MQKLKRDCTPEEWEKISSFKKKWEKRRTPEQMERHRAYHKQWYKNRTEEQSVRYNEKRYRSHYKTQYGITLEQYQEMVIAQENKCKICGITPKERLSVDHCHTTGRVRFLLCKPCNMAVGWSENHPGMLSAISAYLGDY